jgi:hypothetical protein
MAAISASAGTGDRSTSTHPLTSSLLDLQKLRLDWASWMDSGPGGKQLAGASKNEDHPGKEATGTEQEASAYEEGPRDKEKDTNGLPYDEAFPSLAAGNTARSSPRSIPKRP